MIRLDSSGRSGLDYGPGHFLEGMGRSIDSVGTGYYSFDMDSVTLDLDSSISIIPNRFDVFFSLITKIVNHAV